MNHTNGAAQVRLRLPLRPGRARPGGEKRTQPHLHKHPNTADVAAPECGPRPVLLQAFPLEGRWKEGRERDTREREPRGVPLQRAANAAPGLNRKEFPLPRPLRLGGSHLSPGSLSRAFRFVRIYKAGMPACYDVKASPLIPNHPLPRPRTDKPSEWCRKRSEFPMPPILSLKSPASASHRHTLIFLDAQEHTGCAFLRSHVPRARKGPLTDL